jgi:hypothetical protein
MVELKKTSFHLLLDESRTHWTWMPTTGFFLGADANEGAMEVSHGPLAEERQR